MVQDPLQGVRVLLTELPGLGAVNILVDRIHQPPQGLESTVEGKLIYCARDGRRGGFGLLHQLAVLRTVGAHPLGDPAAYVLLDHGQDAAQQVAEIIGQVGVQPADQGVFTEAGIQSEDHLSQEEVAQGVPAVFLGEIERPNHIAETFGHLAPLHLPVPVHMEMAVQGDLGRPEHGGPVNAVRFDDVFGDQVIGLGPEGPRFFAVGIAEAAQVIDQGIKPDVGDIVAIEGERDPPSQTADRPRDAQIFEGLPEKGQHLISVPLGTDEVRVFLEVLDQPLLVLAHTKEVISLLDEGGLDLMVGAFAVLELALGIKALAAEAVLAAVLPEVDLPTVVDPLQEGLNQSLVGGLGGADKAGMGDLQGLPGVAEGGADPVGVRLRFVTGLGGRLGNLVPVLVGPRKKEDTMPRESLEPRERVGQDGRVGVAEVRDVVDVIDRGGNVDDPLTHRDGWRFTRGDPSKRPEGRGA